MKINNKYFSAAVLKVSGLLLAGMLVPSAAHACACGCSVFDVGTGSMFPDLNGVHTNAASPIFGPGMVSLQYVYSDQNHNWSGTSSAPAANNDDKEIRTHFVTLGWQQMFNRSWGIQAQIPYDFRYFKTKDGAGNIISRSWHQLGDIRVEGVYTGFKQDGSAGLTLGVKLPSGSHTVYSDVADRDTQIGTGSTDLLLGSFYHGHLTKDRKWGWFAQARLDLPLMTQEQYRPGLEVDAAAGIDYHGWSLGRVKISPVAQMIMSERARDGGANSDTPNTGYQRILLAPGIEFNVKPVKFYVDAELPVFQNYSGNQLAAPFLLKMSVSLSY